MDNDRTVLLLLLDSCVLCIVRHSLCLEGSSHADWRLSISDSLVGHHSIERMVMDSNSITLINLLVSFAVNHYVLYSRDAIYISILYAYRRWFRRVGQLWYEILDFSCNKSKEELAAVIAYGRKHKMILCMHPHGILPIHAITWTAYCDQYLSDHETNDEVFGFGAAADVVFYVPILRNILGWLSAGSATYQVLRDGLKEVILQYE